MYASVLRQQTCPAVLLVVVVQLQHLADLLPVKRSDDEMVLQVKRVQHTAMLHITSTVANEQCV